MNDQSHYGIFLNYFGTHHTFQTFCDKGINKRLIKQLHGTIEEHLKTLTKLNQKGAGIYFTVNETNLKGRTTEHIKRVRAVFIDLDGYPLPKKFELQPHMIVETSPKKYHCYWLTDDIPMASFTLFQQALSFKFNADSKVKDLPRVMRVAGFYHNKRKPFPVKIVSMIDELPYTREQIRDTLKLKRPENKINSYEIPQYKGKYSGTLRYGMKEGDRHATLVKMLIAIRKRGESYEYAKLEAETFGKLCTPPENPKEIYFQLNDIWKRYEPITTIPS